MMSLSISSNWVACLYLSDCTVSNVFHNSNDNIPEVSCVEWENTFEFPENYVSA